MRFLLYLCSVVMIYYPPLYRDKVRRSPSGAFPLYLAASVFAAFLWLDKAARFARRIDSAIIAVAARYTRLIDGGKQFLRGLVAAFRARRTIRFRETYDTITGKDCFFPLTGDMVSPLLWASPHRVFPLRLMGPLREPSSCLLPHYNSLQTCIRSYGRACVILQTNQLNNPNNLNF